VNLKATSATSAETTPTEVELRARYFVDLEVDYPEAGVTFNLADAVGRLYYVEADRDDDGADDGVDVLEVRMKRSLQPGFIEAITLVADNRVPPGSDESNKTLIHRRKTARPDGRLRFPMPFAALQQDIRDQATSLRDELHERAQVLGSALRWRIGSRGSHQTLSRHGSPEWSVDGKTWRPLVVAGTPIRFGATIFPRVEQATAAEIEAIAASDQGEPVAHAILREAGDNLKRNPRSSLVLAVAAIEVGTKGFIARVAPAAAWLANEAPTPPVVKMMAQYLPSLAGVNGRALKRPTAAVLRLIDAAVAARNMVAHRGENAWPATSQRELLEVVRAYLYALDYASGADWATTLLSAEDRACWLVSQASGQDAPGTAPADSVPGQ
jgi:hypothetical protein